MPRPRQERIRDLTSEGEDLLGAGRPREALEVFERAVFREGDPRARAGLENARAALAEQQRHGELRRAEAERALEAGDLDEARELAVRAREAGAESSGVLAVVELLEARGGFSPKGPASTPPAVPLPAATAPSGTAWPRRLLVVAWALAFALMAAGVASSWERLVGSLVRTPEPSSPVVPETTELPAPTRGQQAVAEARGLIERGDLAGALAVLDGIGREDPAYPFGRRLRRQAVEMLRDRGYGE